MNLDDFRCMRRGAHLSVVNQDEAKLLRPIQINNGQKKNALLLLHGFSSTPAVFRYLLTGLSDYDAIICPVLPGHGESIDAFSAMKAEDLLAYVKHITSNLINDFENVDILGLSLGGVLACYLSNQFNVRHLYLLAPALDLTINLSFNKTLANVLKKLGFNYLRSNAGNICAQNVCEIAYRQLPINSIIELFRLIQNYDFVVPTCPTDLFLGHHDEVVDCEAVAARFTNIPNVTIHWLENSAHVLPLDGDRDVILKCVKDNFAP